MQRNVHLNISACSQGATLRQTNPALTFIVDPTRIFTKLISSF